MDIIWIRTASLSSHFPLCSSLLTHSDERTRGEGRQKHGPGCPVVARTTTHTPKSRRAATQFSGTTKAAGGLLHGRAWRLVPSFFPPPAAVVEERECDQQTPGSLSWISPPCLFAFSLLRFPRRSLLSFVFWTPHFANGLVPCLNCKLWGVRRCPTGRCHGPPVWRAPQGGRTISGARGGKRQQRGFPGHVSVQILSYVLYPVDHWI